MAFLFDHWGIMRRGPLPREAGEALYRKVLLRKTAAGYVGRAGHRWAFNWATKFFQWKEDQARTWELVLVQPCRGFTHVAEEVAPMDKTLLPRRVKVRMTGHGFDLCDDLNRRWSVLNLTAKPSRWSDDWPKQFRVLERMTELEEEKWLTEEEANALLEIWTEGSN